MFETFTFQLLLTVLTGSVGLSTLRANPSWWDDILLGCIFHRPCSIISCSQLFHINTLQNVYYSFSSNTFQFLLQKKKKQIGFNGNGKQKIFHTNGVPDCNPVLVYPIQLVHIDTAPDPLSYTKRQLCMLPSTWANYTTETATHTWSLHSNRAQSAIQS